LVLRPLALTLFLLATPALAAEPSVIKLSCDGELITGEDQKKPVKKVGLIVDLTQHTVTGFPVIGRIDNVSDAMVEFIGSKIDAIGTSSIMGTIDLVTGAAQAWTLVSAKYGNVIQSNSWDLVCVK
jgi:hypothetical protein